MCKKRIYQLLLFFVVPILLSACGSDGNFVATDTGTDITSGVVVDPYISGAILQEIAADGVTVLQRSSSASDDQGRFQFQQPLTVGSIIEIKLSSRGNHVGDSNQVILRRKVLSGDSGDLIVSPLTTLVANGSPEEEVVDLLQSAGLSGFAASDIYLDPMGGLTNRTGTLPDADLLRLHAAMAVGSYLEVNDNSAVTAIDLNFQTLTSLLDTVQETLNAELFQDISTQLASDPGVSNLTLGNVINAAVIQNRTVVALAKVQMADSGQIDPAAIFDQIQIASANMLNETKNQNQSSQRNTTPLDGAALYTSSCATCHGSLATTEIPGSSAAATQSAINQNVGNMGILSNLTPEEVQAIADVLPAAPGVDPSLPPNGTALYASDCAGCHGALPSTDKPGRSVAAIQVAIDGNVGDMGFLSALTTEEVQAIADALPAAPVVDPNLPPDGPALYASECAGCHAPLISTDTPGRSAAAIQVAIDGNVGNMGLLSILTTEEVQAIADALSAAPVVDPTLPPDGPALYASECAGCHAPLITTDTPGRSAAAIQVAIDGNVGNMGFLSTLTTEEVQAIADVLPADTGTGGPDYSDCTACHSTPPDGTTFPNAAGAHAAHRAIGSIGTNCNLCHLDAAHNDTVDLAFPVAYNATGSVATDNLDGTCSSISCHGGKTTPDWWSESIDLTSDCTSCHSLPSTGRHDRSYHRNRSCTACHNSNRMTTHIGNLSTPTFEVSAASTVGGSGTSVGSYNGSTCSSISCHGSKRW